MKTFTLTGERERLQGVFLRGLSAAGKDRERVRLRDTMALRRAFDRAWPMPVEGSTETPAGRALVTIAGRERASFRLGYVRRMTALRLALAGIQRDRHQDEIELVTLTTEYAQALPCRGAMNPADVVEACEEYGISVEALTGAGC